VRRFVTADPFITEPFDTQGLNPYSYVQNNPLNFVDPSGFVIERPIESPPPAEPQRPPDSGPQGPEPSSPQGPGHPPHPEGPEDPGRTDPTGPEGYRGPPEVPTGAEGPDPGNMPQGPYGESMGGTPQKTSFLTGADAPNGTPRDAGGDWPGGARGGVGSDPNAPLGPGKLPGRGGAIGEEPNWESMTEEERQMCNLGLCPGTIFVLVHGSAWFEAAELVGAAAGTVWDWLTDGDEVPEKAKDVWEHIQKSGKAPSGYVGGRTFKNAEGLLPPGGAYKEYDVDPKPPSGTNRNAERLVVDQNTGRAWYTADHYKTFTEIQ
jgi:ribonuclease